MTDPVPGPAAAPSGPEAEAPPEPEAPPEAEAPSGPEAPPEPTPEAPPEPTPEAEAPVPDLREELGVLGEDLKGTVAGTPGQRIRILILMAVIGIVMLLAFAALRASGSGPFSVPSAEVAALIL